MAIAVGVGVGRVTGRFLERRQSWKLAHLAPPCHDWGAHPGKVFQLACRVDIGHTSWVGVSGSSSLSSWSSLTSLFSTAGASLFLLAFFFFLLFFFLGPVAS